MLPHWLIEFVCSWFQVEWECQEHDCLSLDSIARNFLFLTKAHIHVESTLRKCLPCPENCIWILVMYALPIVPRAFTILFFQQIGISDIIWRSRVELFNEMANSSANIHMPDERNAFTCTTIVLKLDLPQSKANAYFDSARNAQITAHFHRFVVCVYFDLQWKSCCYPFYLPPFDLHHRSLLCDERAHAHLINRLSFHLVYTLQRYMVALTEYFV